MTADKYAKPEVERRYMLDVLPADATDPVELFDRYIEGGHLRLRKVEAPGVPAVYKLGHKRRPDPRDAGTVMHTTIYLTEAEHSLLAALPARELRKTRHRIDLDGRPAVVDVLHGAREGLIVLEVGFEPDEDPADFTPPGWVGAETALSGGELAD